MSAETSVEGFAGADYSFDGSSLDEHLSRICDALASARSASWDVGDALVDLCRGLSADADEEPLFRYVATQTGCTVNKLKQHRIVSRTFESGMRDLERAWSWHRAVYNAAKRTNQAPADILALATSGDGWTQRELDAYGSTREQVGWKGACPDCDGYVAVRFRKPGAFVLKGARIACPYCVANNQPGSAYLGSLA